MPFTQPWFEVNFGSAHAGGVGTVGYRLYQDDDSDSVARTTAGIVEIGTNTGNYGVPSVSVPDNAVGIEWDTGGGSPVYATEDVEPYRSQAEAQADVQAAMTAQGYTTARAPYLDELAAANIPADIDTLLTRLSAARAALLDNLSNLDTTVSSRSSHDAAAVDTALSASHGAGSWEGSADWSTAEKNQIRYRLGLDGTQATPTTILGTLELVRKLLNNRLALAEGSSNNWILYDDDDATPLLTYSVTDKDGLAITLDSGAPARRTRGT